MRDECAPRGDGLFVRMLNDTIQPVIYMLDAFRCVRAALANCPLAAHDETARPFRPFGPR